MDEGASQHVAVYPGVVKSIENVRRHLEPHEHALISAVQAWAESEYNLSGRLPAFIEITTAAGVVRVEPR